MTLTCLACGIAAPDVQMTVVEVPADERRIVDQGYPVSWDVRGRVIGMEYRKVVEVAELLAMGPGTAAAGHGAITTDAEEDPPWTKP